MKDPGGAEHAFEDLRGEAMRFLQERATAYPELAHVIRALRAEIGRAVLPDPLPAPGRLPGIRHLGPALEMARAGPMADLAAAFGRLEPYMRWIRTEHYRDRLGDDYMTNYCYTSNSRQA